MLVLSAATAAWAQPSATGTTLNVTPNTVAPDTAVTLTATVTSTTAGTITGQVLFCNASATYCEDSAIIGSAWMITSGTALGTATVHKTFGPGTYSIQAVFKGTNVYATSTSTMATVTASSGPLPTTNTISATGVAGSYALNATVWAGGTATPTGTVSFLDATNSNSLLGSALLSSAVPTSGFFFAGTSGPATSSSNNQATAVGDFNNDGNLDYVVAGLNSSATATIMLGSGNGTFTAVTAGGAPYSVGSYPEGAVVADFNGDGNPDIAFANSASNGVTILLGNGDGTFTPAASPAVGYAASIAVADFNGDGIPDLAVSNNASGYVVTILLGEGDGTFNVGTSVPVPQWSINPQGIVAMDFHGDGKMDLAVTSANNNSPSSYVVTILLGNGDGTFTQGQTYNTGNGDQSMVGGDFNGDGIPDLAIANYYDDTVTILLGNGDGSFTPAALPLPATGAGPFAIVAGDFNNDGILDLATANYYANTVTILLGNGDGTFTAASSAPATGGGPDGLVPGDFNGDGLLDITTANYEVTTQSILLQATSSTTVTVSGVSVSGTDNVFASYSSGDGNYSSSQSSTVAINSILLTAQTITFPNPGAQTYGTPLTLSASATSGLPVSFTVTGPATLSGSTLLTFTGIGSVTVQATQGGNGSYAPAAPVSVTFTVNPASQTITFPNPGPLPNGVAPVTLTATASSGLPVTYTLISGPGSLSGNTLTITDVGSIVVEADQAGNANYLAAPSVQIAISVVTADFTVVPASSMPTTVPAGQTATVPVTINAAVGFTATISFTCTVPPAMLEASCSAGSVQVTGSAPVAAKVIVNTTGPHQVSASSWSKPWNALPSGIAFVAVVVASGAGRKKLRKGMLLAALMIVMLAVLGGCSGSTSGSATKTDPGTPAETYNLTLVGTNGTANYTTTLVVTVE
ncbi:MAG: VCBS repeat-containing protein [Terriglobales bacterium]